MSLPSVAPYPKEILSLQDPQGFEDAFWTLWGTADWKNYEACYETLEGHYEHFYGQRRYSDYVTYRVCTFKRHKKRRQKAALKA